MIRKLLKTVAAIVAAAGLAGGAVMAQSVPMQTVKDSAVAGRLVINGHKIFISGMNIAWKSFGNDLKDNTSIDVSAFTRYIQDIHSAGGNAVRWWLHNDARYCPKVDANGKVTGLANTSISNMRKVLDIAYNNGVVVSMCLFSHNLMKSNGQGTQSIDNNYKLFTSPANMDTYIEKGLRPILDSIGNHPAVMCWEVFNEPEGMSTEFGSGWGMYKTIPYDDIITFTAKVAVEVHSRTKKMVSTGIHEFNKTSYFPKYTDANLRSKVNNDQKAYLDFYMAHFYPEHQGTDKSPFSHKASFWGDKPILIGEFPAKSWNSGYYQTIQSGTGLTIIDAYARAYDSGYCGALSWAMNEAPANNFGDYSTTKPAMQALAAKHQTDIDLGANVIIPPPPTGDLALKLALTNLPKEGTNSDGGPWNELGTSKDASFSGKTNLTFEMYIQSGSNTNLTIVPVVKDGNWTWSPAQTESFSLAGKPVGQWFTVTIPVSAFKASEEGKTFNPAQVTEFVIQYFAKDASYTGTIYFDNFKLDGTTLFDFNQAGSEWSTAADGALVSLASRPSPTSIISGNKASGAISRAPAVSVTGNVLNVKSLNNQEMTVKLVNIRGKTVARFSVSGSGQFPLTKVPAGNYLVELTANGKKIGSSRVVVR